MNIFYQRAFWLNLAGAGVIAIVAAVPILMSGVLDRGFEIAKQALAEPLAILACGTVLLGAGWRWILRLGMATKIAAGALAVFFLLAVISTALSENPAVAVFGGYLRREGLLAWLTYGAFFFAALGWAGRAARVESLLDILLLSSVIPAVYVLQQRLDLDFYFVLDREFTRPGGTLGSPLFLAAYFGVLLPATAARCWWARRQFSELAQWLTVGALQLCGLLVTQSRGPLLAAVLGMLLLACCVAGRERARRALVFMGAVFAVIVSSVIAVNTVPAARQWAQTAPVLGRMVFNMDRDAGAETQRASRSAASRLGLWEAGMATFAAAPLESKLLGYGPELAYEHYFPHMPPSVMRLLGNEVFHSFDRMHADTLDIGLNFGLIAWLAYALFFATVIFAAARALFGLTGIATVWIFFAFTCGCGALASIAASGIGLSTAVAPAFGLGLAAGWLLFIAGCAWRALGCGASAQTAAHTKRWMLLAGLVSALLVFWVDAQINVPVPTTRLVSFAIAACILILADALMRGTAADAHGEPPSDDYVRVWGVACALVAACASWLPAGTFDPAQDAGRWLLRAVPLLIFLGIAAWAWRQAARNSDSFSSRAASWWLAIVIGLPALYAAVHYALTVQPDAAPGFDQVRTIAMTSFAGPVFMFALCVTIGWLAGRREAGEGAQLISRTARWSISAVVVAMALVAAVEWRATRASVALRLAELVSVKFPQLSEQLFAEAIGNLPYERHYRRQLVYDLLGKAIIDIRGLEEASRPSVVTPDRIGAMVRNLNAAETAARAAAAMFPRDPWMVVALANVLQIEALRALRPLDPGGGMRAAQEANELFARAHRMFPVEPVILRNWAELVADQGNAADAYRLLDLMENVIPNDPEPYSARITIARQAGDANVISVTLARARSALDPSEFNRLSIVAGEQQKQPGGR